LATLAVAGADMPVRNTARAKRQERQDVACRYGKGGGRSKSTPRMEKTGKLVSAYDGA
jgi:hypothetical protein